MTGKIRSNHPEVFLEKWCSENVEQIYRRIIPMPKVDFNKVALQSQVALKSHFGKGFSYKFAEYFQSTFY